MEVLLQDQSAIHSLEQLLDRLGATARDRQEISVGNMVDAAGRRSFGPLLLVLGLIPLSPLSGIPGLPTVMALGALLIAGQLLLGKHSFWLPVWLLRKKTSHEKFCQALRFLRPLARVADRLSRRRLSFLIEGPAIYAIAVLVICIALTMPPLELIPFANTLAGAALSTLGLALTTQDGLLAALAFILCALGIGLLLNSLLN